MPNIYLNRSKLSFTDEHKYLGIIICNDMYDDADMLQQTSALYSRGNILISKFSKCDGHVKVRLFKTYCTSFYGANLWTHYRKKAFNKIKFAYYSVFKRLFNVQDFNIIQTKLVELGIDDFKVILRKVAGSLYKNLYSSSNGIISAIVNSLYFCDSTFYKDWMANLFLL